MIFFYLNDIYFKIYFDFHYLSYIKLNLEPNIMPKKSLIFYILKKNSLKFIIIQPQVNNYNSED